VIWERWWGKESDGTTTDSSGSFSFRNLLDPSFTNLLDEHTIVAIKVMGDKYLTHWEHRQVKDKEGEDLTLSIEINARPKIPNVVITKNQIILKKPIHFVPTGAVYDAGTINSDSYALLEEIADILNKNPKIKKIEIQGHTDNTGDPEHNMQLSQSRADSVKAWLESHGVDGGRLGAKGYGQTRPIVPNVTAVNRATNRRILLVIMEQDK